MSSSGASSSALTRLARQPLPGAPDGVTAFENVSVVPMDSDRVLTGQTVLIQGGWITAMGPSSTIRIPEGATRIDGRGQYVIPGLCDMHAHVILDPFLSVLEDTSQSALVRMFAEAGAFQHALHLDSADVDTYTKRVLMLWLAQGATTVRLMDYDWPTVSQSELRIKARQAAGEVLAPRIYNTGPWGPENYRHATTSPDSQPRLDSIASYLAAFKAAGYDFIKPYFESPIVLDSVVTIGRRLGLPASGHLPQGTTIEQAIREGYTGIEHQLWGAERPSPETGYASESIDWRHPDTARVLALIDLMRSHGVWSIPTLAHFEGAVLGHAHGGSKTWALDQWLVRTLQQKGVGLLVGTDNPAGIGLHLEMQALVGAGLTPFQALTADTRNVAKYFGTLDESGTVAIGKRADLVLLKGNPLQDIRNTTEIAGVMLGGRWLPSATLDRLAQESTHLGKRVDSIYFASPDSTRGK